MPRNYRVEVSEQAQRDAEQIFAFIAVDKPKAAAKWFRSFGKNARSLSRLPFGCEVIPEVAELDLSFEYRHLLFGRYRIIYRVTEDTVFVVRVLHTARNVTASFFRN